MINDFEEEEIVIAFDLDYTLWDFWVDTHVSPPFKKNKNGKVIDSCGKTIELYSEIRKILERIKQMSNTHLVSVSRTDAPLLAIELLELLDIRNYFEIMEFDRGPKPVALKRISKRLDCSLGNIILFDDEERNICDVQNIGLSTAILVPNGGLTSDLFEFSMNDFREKIKTQRRNK